MKIVGVIPARYASTRFPGKPLVEIAGKPMLTWVIEAAQKANFLSEVLVATDDQRIADLAKKSGVKAVMTESELPTGSDRVWQAVKNLNDVDVVLNIQGDEPLITGLVLDQLVAPFINGEAVEMATLGRKITQEDLLSPNTAKIVLNKRSEAIYFSRFPIPYSREKNYALAACLKHIGIYAYRKDFLQKFCATKPTDAELMEGLEQLRALYLGAKIKVMEVDHDSWGVDVPDDVKKIEGMLLAKGISKGARS